MTQSKYTQGLKNALDSCQFLPEDRIFLITDNEIVISYQLTYIRRQNQNVLAYGCRDVETILE